jgi:hypothetical protein
METKPDQMKEPVAETTSEADKAGFEKIRRLTEEEGWTFGGHVFLGKEEGHKEQTYQVTLKKGDLVENVFLTKPYPKMFFANDAAKGEGEVSKDTSL